MSFVESVLHRGSLAPTYLPIKQEETEQSDTEQHRGRATIRNRDYRSAGLGSCRYQ